MCEKNCKTCGCKTKYIPYQLCPLCEGTGISLMLTGEDTDTFMICDVCNGKKTVPMYEDKEYPDTIN